MENYFRKLLVYKMKLWVSDGWYHKMKQLTCIFIYAMLMEILKDKERVFSKQLFWITPFGVKAIRTAGSTAADGNFGCLID